MSISPFPSSSHLSSLSPSYSNSQKKSSSPSSTPSVSVSVYPSPSSSPHSDVPITDPSHSISSFSLREEILSLLSTRPLNSLTPRVVRSHLENIFNLSEGQLMSRNAEIKSLVQKEAANVQYHTRENNGNDSNIRNNIGIPYLHENVNPHVPSHLPPRHSPPLSFSSPLHETKKNGNHPNDHQNNSDNHQDIHISHRIPPKRKSLELNENENDNDQGNDPRDDHHDDDSDDNVNPQKRIKANMKNSSFASEDQSNEEVSFENNQSHQNNHNNHRNSNPDAYRSANATNINGNNHNGHGRKTPIPLPLPHSRGTVPSGLSRGRVNVPSPSPSPSPLPLPLAIRVKNEILSSSSSHYHRQNQNPHDSRANYINENPNGDDGVGDGYHHDGNDGDEEGKVPIHHHLNVNRRVHIPPPSLQKPPRVPSNIYVNSPSPSPSPSPSTDSSDPQSLGSWHRDDKDFPYLPLSARHRVTIKIWNRRVFCDLREFYVDNDGEMKPTKKGISLTAEAMEEMFSNQMEIKKLLQTLQREVGGTGGK